MSCTPTCEGYSGAGSSCGPLVLDDAGMVVASAPPLNIYDSVWSPLSAGNYSLLREPSAAELCDGPADPSAWAGKLILGGKFAIRTMCPYRQRALVAAQAGAAGILFRGKPHSPFDWSGWAVDSASLAPASFLFMSTYDCVGAAIGTEAAPLQTDGGNLTLAFLESSVTPLVGLYTGASIFFAVLCLVLMVCASAFGVYQVSRLREAIDRSSIAVIALETLSQMFFFLRTLNGPGFDVGYRMVIPHWVYRIMQSLFQDLNMIALLIVGGQLRQTMKQVTSAGYSDRDSAEEEPSNAALSWLKHHRHLLFNCVVLLVILLDLFIAILDSIYDSFMSDINIVVMVFHLFFFGFMSWYYYAQTKRVDNALKKISKVLGAGANERMALFSRNVGRVSRALAATTSLLVLFCVFLITLPGATEIYYALTLPVFSITGIVYTITALLLMSSYRPASSDKKDPRYSLGKQASLERMASELPAGALAAINAGGSMKTITITVNDNDRASAGSESSPMPGSGPPSRAGSGGPSMFRDDSSRRSGDPPARSPSPLKRAGSSFKEASKKIGGSSFNLFDNLPPAQDAAGAMAAANAAANQAANPPSDQRTTSEPTSPKSPPATEAASAPAPAE